MPRGGTGEGLAGHRRHRSGILGHLAIRGHRGGDVGIYFYWNGGRLGTPHIVPELSSKHHLRGGSRRKTPSRTREAFLGRRRQYSATMPRKKAGLHSPYLPKHAPCTCEMGDASDEMIQKRRTMGHVHGKAFRRQFDKGLHAKGSTIEPSATHLNPKPLLKVTVTLKTRLTREGPPIKIHHGRPNLM